MSLLEHVEFDLWRPYIVERYSRDGGHENPRLRIELRAPEDVLQAALAFQMRCVACGRLMHPFRLRKGSRVEDYGSGVYFAAACPLNVSVGCSRSRAAAEEYKRVTASVVALTGGRARPQGALGLFGDDK
jgi:hypothetical protein